MHVEGVIRCPFVQEWRQEIYFELSAIPKLFEKLVCDVITPIIRRLISDEQHGFVGGRSAVTSLVEFCLE
jgi:phenylalanine-4-hydroxylase